MKWNEIVVEGVNFYCPTCDELLGKESELNANDSWHCGNCGWDKSDGGARHEDDPSRGQSDDRYQAPEKPASPAPKPQPKSKQTLVKQSGDFEARVYPGRKAGGLYYLGQTGAHIDISGGCVGEVAKKEDGTFVATRRLMYGRSVNLGSFANMTLAMNALKKRFKGELNRK